MSRNSRTTPPRWTVAAPWLGPAWLALLASCAGEPRGSGATSPPVPATPLLEAVESDLGASVSVFDAKASRGFGGAAATATIEYSLPSPGHVRIVVFDMAGRELGRVVDGWRPQGQHVAEFSIGVGRRQASLYRVEWSGQSLNGKLPTGP